MANWDWDWIPGEQATPTPPAAPRQRWSVALLAAMVLGAAGAVAWYNALGNPFVHEDVPAVVDNPTIRSLWPLQPIFSPPDDTAVSGWPLVNLTFAINHALGGPAAVGYHATNLGIHVLAAIMLFALVRRMLRMSTLSGRFGSRASVPAFLTALLWMLHPLQTAVVSSVASRGEALAGLFSLVACYAFLQAIESRHPRGWKLAVVGACILGVASSRTAAAVPALLLVADAAFVAGSLREVWRRRRGLYFGLSSSWLLLALLVASTAGTDPEAHLDPAVSAWSYALTQGGAILRYLWLAAWPHPLVFDYGGMPATGVLRVLVSTLAVLVLAGASLWALRRRHPAGFAGLWFFLLLAPTSSIWPVAGTTIAEQRMYLPLAALVGTFVLALWALAPARRVAVGAVCGLIAAASLGLTHQRNQVYRSELVLWENTVAVRPDNPRALCRLGLALLQAGRRTEAMRCFERALAFAPDYPEVHSNLGSFRYHEGDITAAINHFEQLVRLRPRLPAAYNSLGRALIEDGRLNEAIDRHEHAVRLAPEWNEGRVNLGQVLLRAGRWLEAVEHYEHALGTRPDDPITHFELGLVLERSGRRLSALDHYTHAARLDPEHEAAREARDRLARELSLPSGARPR